MARTFDPDHYRIRPGQKFTLADFAPDDTGGLERAAAEECFATLRAQLIDLQTLLYADGSQALLVVLQAMDTAGKDSTIRHVFQGVNPQGCQVVSFKAPNDTELRHDFLWRIHQGVPRKGYLGVFNRSHYEDVLIARVKNLVAPKVWKSRFDHINAFEAMLQDEGTAVVKFYLHISKDYQKQRLQRRLDDPAKHWKFDPADLAERQRWDDYMAAYEDTLARCSTKRAPWYVIPAEHRWFRNLLITQILVERLQGMGLEYPKATFDPCGIVIE